MMKIRMKSPMMLTVREAYERYLQGCYAKNLAQKTIQDYQEKLKPFVEFYGSVYVNEISADTIEKYTVRLKSVHNINDVSVAIYIRTLRAFLYWCMDNEGSKHFKITVPKSGKKIKETYSDNELDMLLKKPNMNKCSFTEYKIWVFENYLLGTGNRLSSAMNVKIGDVDFSSNVIVLKKMKNRNQQIIPLSHSLSGILSEYLQIRGGKCDDYLFCTDCGEKATPKSYQHAVYHYNHRRGVQKTSIHAFRHTFAKHWVLAGGDVFRLQKILGHSNISVTKEYVELFAPDLQQDFDRFNPLDARRVGKEKIRIRQRHGK